MKFLVILAIFATVLVANTWAAPAPQDPVEIVVSEMDIKPEGGYSFNFEQSDGTKRQEEGTVINAGEENEAIAVTGSFSFVAPDGVTYTVTYTADQEGFKPTGDHLV